MAVYHHYRVFFDLYDAKGAHKFYSSHTFSTLSSASDFYERTFLEYTVNGYIVSRSGILYDRECIGYFNGCSSHI